MKSADLKEQFTKLRIAHWNNIAKKELHFKKASNFYHSQVKDIYRNQIPKKLKVLELGCGQGDLLAAVEPSMGVGVDFSEEMVSRAQEFYPNLKFYCADVHKINFYETFDVIILSDLINDLWDVQVLLKRMKPWCHPGTRIIMNIWSRLWQTPLSMARKFGQATPLLEQSWFAPNDLINLLVLEGYEVVKHSPDLLLPFDLFGIERIFNKYIAKLPLFNIFCLTHLFIVRASMLPVWEHTAPLVSVVVPARNESGNIANIIQTIPEMGAGTEIIFVEGNSTDDTWHVIQQQITANPERNCKALQQRGKGKGDAVRTGFAAAEGDVFMILDADLTVPAEMLPRFLDALTSGRCEFVNGVRLVYPMAENAMRFCNTAANKGFSLIFSWILGQPIKDTLCGTKVLSKHHYERLAANRLYFGDFDPFGDYDLIFGAAKLNLKILDLPIRYQDRTYGDTNIHRWRHGIVLLRMVFYALKRLKFV